MPNQVRIAKAGTTIDGRTITREQITQMAESYNPKDEYTALINIEHIRGILPDGDFKAYGDVKALSTEEDGDDLYLTAELNPHPDLIAMNKNGQKLFTSIEMHPNFAATGKAYLIGLAVTNSPASRGTEMLKFSIQHDGDKANLFSEYVEADITDETSDTPDGGSAIIDRLNALLAKVAKLSSAAPQQEQPTEKPDETTDAETQFASADSVLDLATIQKQAAEDMTKLTEQVNSVSADLNALIKKLNTTPLAGNRPEMTGGDGAALTDC